ncbi:MAG: hypothetical protein V4592_18035 [Bacteroidota bacterium]
MKKLNKIILAIGIISCLSACKKTEQNGPAASGVINVTNAVIGGSTITMTTTNSIISTNNTVGNNASAFFPLISSNVPINLGVPGVAATLTSAAIPAITYYSQNLTVDNRSNYSLFLTGTSSSAIDNVLIKETYPQAYADSVCGVRFINLSPASNPISVNILGSPNGSEASSLSYKSYGNFKQYPAKAVNKTILFEIRDAATGVLLYPTNGSGYSINVPYFHNVTLAYRGTGSGVGIIINKDY